MSTAAISPTERIVATIDGAIGWLVLNNPARRNALSLDMWQAIPACLDRFEREAGVRVVVLRGAGDRAFTSGADVSEFERLRGTPTDQERYSTISETALTRLQQFPKPTIAMIQGYCMSIGLGIALACDLRFAGSSAHFASLAARLSLSYRWSDIKKVVDLIGPARTKDFFYSARHVPADEALAMGLVEYLRPDVEIEAFTRAYCARITENAPLSMTATKRIVAELGKPSSEIDRTLCKTIVAGCYASEDYVEGRRAFMEKRQPVFRGK